MSATTSDGYCSQKVLHMAMELSTKKWVLGFSTGPARAPRIRQVAARDISAVMREVGLARAKFGLDEEAPVVSCYEAGRDGFWIDRCLKDQGLENIILDSASIEQNRRRKQLKTDRLDVKKMVRMLCRWQGGEKDVFRPVCVPSEEDEDLRHLHRELKTLQGDHTRVVNRIRALLAGLGLNSRIALDAQFLSWLQQARQWNGVPVPVGVGARLQRQFGRLRQLEVEIGELNRERRDRIRAEDSLQAQQVRTLLGLKAIGPTSAWLLVHEVFGWRHFANSRHLASFTGLVGAPFDSGDTNHDQGITKAGNKWLRGVLIEVAWMWLRYQPQSALSRWYEERFGGQGKRMRKIGIVALARKLIIALWRYLEKGIPPEGAMLVAWHTKVGLRKPPALAA